MLAACSPRTFPRSLARSSSSSIKTWMESPLYTPPNPDKPHEDLSLFQVSVGMRNYLHSVQQKFEQRSNIQRKPDKT